MKQLAGKWLYGLLFCLVLPALLWVWAINLDVSLPVPLQSFGWIVATVGLLLVVIAMLNLWFQGKGLPMNAYPPKKRVTGGAYKILAHPIYVGFVLVCAGISISSGNAAGLYIITPTVALCSIALVMGYEHEDIKKRFGPAPANTDAPFAHRFISMLKVWIAWAVGYKWLVWMGYDDSYFDTVLSWERSLPVMEWMVIPYVAAYPLAVITPFIIDKKLFPGFRNEAWAVVLIGLFLQFIFPFYATPRAVETHGWMADIIVWHHNMAGPAAAFPSLHVLWAFVCARWLGLGFPRLRVAVWCLSWFIALSCFWTGIHSILDIVAGAIVYWMIMNRLVLINFFQSLSEWLANSWNERRLGPLRIINHAWYSGLAGFVAGLILAQFTPYLLQLDIIILSALVGGAVWGQWVEGSPSMLRPFGYYGAIMGGMLAMMVIHLTMGIPVVYWLGVFAVATPFTQAIGRLRCLVQGCCHGRLSGASGIRYFNDHTRVAKIPELRARYIHNTQGYSIALNVLAGVLLLRLSYAGASPGILGGIYFILTGAFRFVEEAYRGEPQTKSIAGLRLYQWMAIGSIFLGCVLTTVQTQYRIEVNWNFGLPVFAMSLVAGLAWAFGMSMDFPRSSIRFSRLTG